MGRKAMDLVGMRFGKLTVIKRAEEKYKRDVLWECICDCGARKNVPGSGLSGGRVKTCNTGCKRLKGSRWSRMTSEQKEHENVRKKMWEEKNKEAVRKRKRIYYESRLEFHKAYERNRQYQKLYGIAISDYDKMLAAQNGRCAICGTTNAGKETKTGKRFFAVDHCHETGKIRGLLCVACNTRLGYLTWFEKNKEAVASYLSPKPHLKVVA